MICDISCDCVEEIILGLRIPIASHYIFYKQEMGIRTALVMRFS